MSVFFTSDNHFGHANIIKYCNRPYLSTEDMDEDLIDRWNKRVGQNDTVFITGDMIFRLNGNPEELLEKLKGKKHLIIGNHDSYWMKHVNLNKYFQSVNSYLETTDGQHRLIFSHYPMLSWNHQRKSYMIHGHIHNDTSMDYWPMIKARDNLLNAGVDVNNFEPVSLEELIKNNRKFKENH